MSGKSEGELFDLEMRTMHFGLSQMGIDASDILTDEKVMQFAIDCLANTADIAQLGSDPDYLRKVLGGDEDGDSN